MRRGTKILLVVSVVAIVVVAYMAVVGVSAEKEEIGPTVDPTGEDREPIAYGYFSLSIGIDNEIGGYDADITDWNEEIYYADSTQKLALYETDKWNLLGIWTDDIDVKMVCKITGPDKYEAVWEEKYTIELSEWGYEWTDLQSGYADFWDNGEYRAQVSVYTDGPEFDGLAASATFSFTV